MTEPEITVTLTMDEAKALREAIGEGLRCGVVQSYSAVNTGTYKLEAGMLTLDPHCFTEEFKNIAGSDHD